MRLLHGAALLLVVLLVGCGGGEADRPADAALESPSPEALARLINNTEELRSPVLIEVPSNFPSLTAKTLASLGLLAPVEGGEAKWELTESGRSEVRVEKEFQTGIPVYYFPVGTREVTEVNGVRDFPRHRGIKQAEFTYRVVPTAIGQRLVEAGVTVAELADQDHRLKALLILHDDGWRVQRVGT